MTQAFTVHDNQPLHRYEVHDVDGELAGFARYLRKLHGEQEVAIFNHTVVYPDYQGQGVGGVLARAALDDTRMRGDLVDPVCPFIEGWIEKHPEYQDLLVDRG